MYRPDFETYFMSMAVLASSRSSCVRRSVGAVTVRDRHILGSGYNGAPSGAEHCVNSGCLRQAMNVPSGQKHEICRGVHAEQNAITQAAKHGYSVAGSTLYCTTHPCVICAKLIINSGIVEVVYLDAYNDTLSEAILKESGVVLRKFESDQKGEKYLSDMMMIVSALKDM